MAALSRILRSPLRGGTFRRCVSNSLLPPGSSSAPFLPSRVFRSAAVFRAPFSFPGDPSSYTSLCSSFAATYRPLSTKANTSDGTDEFEDDPFSDEVEEEEQTADEWEEEEEGNKPELGDGGDGGGIVLNNVPWGEPVLEIAREALSQLGDDVELFAFKTSPRGYIYVRIDKISNKYGCPSMEEIESYSQEYKKRLDEARALGKIPKNLALEVSSPGAERLLRVPDDLSRFQDMPMMVNYVDVEAPANCPEKTGVFFLESIETDLGSCVWKLADVKENRDPQSKGRGLSRKQKDWRLKLPHGNCRMVMLYLDY